MCRARSLFKLVLVLDHREGWPCQSLLQLCSSNPLKQLEPTSSWLRTRDHYNQTAVEVVHFHSSSVKVSIRPADWQLRLLHYHCHSRSRPLFVIRVSTSTLPHTVPHGQRDGYEGHDRPVQVRNRFPQRDTQQLQAERDCGHRKAHCTIPDRLVKERPYRAMLRAWVRTDPRVQRLRETCRRHNRTKCNTTQSTLRQHTLATIDSLTSKHDGKAQLGVQIGKMWAGAL